MLLSPLIDQTRKSCEREKANERRLYTYIEVKQTEHEGSQEAESTQEKDPHHVDYVFYL